MVESGLELFRELSLGTVMAYFSTSRVLDLTLLTSSATRCQRRALIC
jgi:hypothetical protein